MIITTGNESNRNLPLRVYLPLTEKSLQFLLDLQDKINNGTYSLNVVGKYLYNTGDFKRFYYVFSDEVDDIEVWKGGANRISFIIITGKVTGVQSTKDSISYDIQTKEASFKVFVNNKKSKSFSIGDNVRCICRIDLYKGFYNLWASKMEKIDQEC